MPLLDDAFQTVERENSIRISELRTYWSSIKAKASSPPTPQSFEYLVGAGLTLVYCYGALEFCLNRCVGQMTELIDDYKVRIKDISPALLCLALDPEVKSTLSAGKGSYFAKRLSLFSKTHSKEVVKLHPEFLSSDLQNVWAKSITNVFTAFSVETYPIYNKSIIGKIDALVDDRNAIAHGRETPEKIASKYTVPAMDATIHWISLQTEHMISTFDGFYKERGFILSAHRKRYERRDQKS